MAVSCDIMRTETAAGGRTAALIHDSAQKPRVESPAAAAIEPIPGAKTTVAPMATCTTSRLFQLVTAPPAAVTPSAVLQLARTPAPARVARSARAHAREGAPPKPPEISSRRPPAAH